MFSTEIAISLAQIATILRNNLKSLAVFDVRTLPSQDVSFTDIQPITSSHKIEKEVRLNEIYIPSSKLFQ